MFHLKISRLSVRPAGLDAITMALEYLSKVQILNEENSNHHKWVCFVINKDGH